MKVLVAESHSDKDAILKEAKDFNLSQEYLNSVEQKFDNDATNGADLFYNDNGLVMLLIVYPHTSILEIASTMIHEGRHAADTVIDSVGLEGKESFAYLNEYITLKLIKDYLKDE